MKSAQQPVWACKSFHATQTPHANVTAAPSLAAHVTFRQFGLGRAKIRELAFQGNIPGVTKASW